MQFESSKSLPQLTPEGGLSFFLFCRVFNALLLTRLRVSPGGGGGGGVFFFFFSFFSRFVRARQMIVDSGIDSGVIRCVEVVFPLYNSRFQCCG